ncbi:MAG: calcium-binding protein [Methylobacter sp.]
MSSIFYLSSVSREYYGTGAFTYIKDPLQKRAINDAASALGVSASAIAGAMAEENNDYWQKQTLNDLSDNYALSSADPSAIFADANVWGPVIALTTYFAQGLFGIGKRTHDQWAADYAAVGGDNGYAPSLMDKILHPVYMDLGYGNFKMSTAIRLVQQYAGTYQNLGLSEYINNYAQLAADLANPTKNVTAKLYGLMIKEAGSWFTAHNAYGADWATLPQEIKDALYVTYTNLGPAKMQEVFDTTTTNGAPYEPLPAAGTGGGVNHLYNAYDIANAIGVTDYAGSGSDANQLIFVNNAGTWQQIAKQETDQGAAYREALIKLRPFAVVDGNYDSGAGVRDDFSDQYLQDRTDMLALKMEFRNSGILPDHNILYKDAASPVYYQDKASQLSIVLGSTVDAEQIIFGGNDDDALTGAIKDDHLYGGDGADTLTGNVGNDYLEGGMGSDTYVYNDGDGTDTILDSDGQGSIIYNEVTLSGGSQYGDARVHRDTKKHLYIDIGQGLVIDGNIMIKDYQSGNLNLTMSGAVAVTSPQTTLEIVGDFASLDSGTDALGNIITDPSQAEANREDTLYDSPGNDRILSGGGKDIVTALRGGDDLIEAGSGQDKVNGGAGNDVIIGGEDNDILAGGANDDRIYADAQISVADAIAAGNSQTGSGLKGEWLAGNAGDDILISGIGNDVLTGGGGNDLLIGGAGDDDISGDADYVASDFNWAITTTNGVRQYSPVVGDIAPAGAGADVIYAGAGNDYVWAGQGNDVLFGEDGNDALNGQEGNDVIMGGAGNDIVAGQEGDDVLIGGAGNDILIGGTGKDTYIFNRGDGCDTVIDTEKDSNLIFGAGISTKDITLRLGSLELDLGNGDQVHINGFDQNDVFNSSSVSTFDFADGTELSIEQLLARGFDLDGTGQDDSITGTNTTDRINGLAGNDSLWGGGGNDTLDGGAGADQLQGGAGDDLYLNVTGEDTISDIEGHNTIQLAYATGVGADGLKATYYGNQNQYLRLDISLDNGETLKIQDAFFGTEADLRFANGNQLDLETLVGTSVTTSLNLQQGDNGGKLYGGAAADNLHGGSGDDVVSGANGNDNLYGGAGNDTLRGGDGGDYLQGDDGDDSLNGGSGVDFLSGGAGNDTYVVDADAGGDIIIDSQGNNIIRLTGNLITTLSATIAGTGTNSTLTLSVDGAPIATLIGSVDSYHFAFDDGAQLSLDQLLLNYRVDPITLQGDDNANTLYGGRADDTLYGNGGDDTLDGGSGNDTLDGGAGNDSYVFSSTSGHDVISWQNGEALGDRIVFATGIQYADLNISGLANGDLVIAVNNHDASLTLRNWFHSESRPTQFQFADGTVISPEQIAAWHIPPIIGSAGDDVLTGSAYDDVIQGLDGNDILYGGGGNDTLEGGVGRDSYVLRIGNGLDSVIETGGEASVIKLENTPMSDLFAQRSGDDLTLKALGGGEGGLVLKDYYAHTTDWTVVDYSGTEQPLAGVLADNESRRAATDKMTYLEEAFTADWRAALLKDGVGIAGATQMADGRFELKPVVNLNYYQIQSTNLSGSVTNYHEEGSLYSGALTFTSFGSRTINSNDAQINLNGGRDAIQNTFISSALVDMTLDNWTLTNTSDTYEIRDPGQTIYRSHLFTLPPGTNSFNTGGYTLYPTSITGQYLLAGDEYVPGNLTGHQQNTNINAGAEVLSMTSANGNQTEALDLAHAVLNQQSLPQSLTLNLDQFDKNIELTTLNAGDDDNYIKVISFPGLSYIVHAGGGDDVVDFNGRQGEDTLFNNWDVTSPGIFMDGGAGDDTLLVRNDGTNDVLIGGTGLNYLKGSGGSDRYILSAADGLDLIDLSTTSSEQSVDTVELPEGITRDMLTMTFGQAAAAGQVRATLNLAWNGQDHATILLSGSGNFDHALVKFADGATVALEDLVAGTPATEDVAYYAGNVRSAIATSPGSLVGKEDDNVLVVQTDGTTTVTTGIGRNLLLGYNVESTINLQLTADSQTWVDYDFTAQNGPTVANLQISGTTTAQLHFQSNTFYAAGLSFCSLRRDGEDLVLQSPSDQELRFTGWFVESMPHQVEFESSNFGNFEHRSLQKWVDQFAARSGGVIQDGSSATISSLGWNIAKVDPGNWGDYYPLGQDALDWQIPLERLGTDGGDSLIAANDYGWTLLGLAGNDVLQGAAGDDYLDGGVGNDTLLGGAGSDEYYFGLGSGTDTISDLSISGSGDINTVYIGEVLPVDITVTSDGSHIILSIDGTDDKLIIQWERQNGYLIQQIQFDDGTVWDADMLEAMTMPYDEGTGTVQSSVSYTLGAHMKNLTLTGTAAINGTGNRLDNVLIGNSAVNILTGGKGNDILDGGSGADTLIGGLGNDTYIVDDSDDVVKETSALGTEIDTVLSSVTYTLAAHIENLTLTGTSAINGTGNNLSNTLTGNSKDNVLNGGAGADQLLGGLGNDTYVVDKVNDVVTENQDEGTDTVQSSVTYILSDNIENLTLTGTAAISGTGNSLDNLLLGNSGKNMLDGGIGADTLMGGMGNDSYMVDNAGDVVTENADEGIDTVQSSISYTLSDNIEKLILTGTEALDGTGNALDNTLTGNDAANVLDGGIGADTLIGGLGNDTYIVDDTGDVIKETSTLSSEIDAVLSSITYTLTAHVENLILTGTSAIDGTGNGLNNILIGNSGNNALTGTNGNDLLKGGLGNDILKGNAGNDILQGGADDDTLSDSAGVNLLDGGLGIDTLTGNASNEMFVGGIGNDTISTGNGADIIAFNRGDGMDIVNGGVGTDNTLSLGGGIEYSDLALSKSGKDLILEMGTGDQIALNGWYNTNANRKSVLNLQVVTDNMAGFDHASSDPLLNKSIQNFDFIAIVNAFDQASGGSANFMHWSVTNSLLAAHLSAGDSGALGGNLAYQYGKNGNFSRFSQAVAQEVLDDSLFGVSQQALNDLSGTGVGIGWLI